LYFYCISKKRFQSTGFIVSGLKQIGRVVVAFVHYNNRVVDKIRTKQRAHTDSLVPFGCWLLVRALLPQGPLFGAW
jgi:hypothetical protein